MNDRDEYKSSFEDKRIVLIYIIVIVAILLGVTYALESVSIAFNLETGIVALDEDAYGSTTFDSSNIDLVPILDSDVETRTDNVIKIDFTVGGAENNTVETIIYDIALVDLNLDCNLLSEYFKWKLVKDGEDVANGSFSYTFDTITNGRLVLTNPQFDLPDYSATEEGYHHFSFYIWLSDSCQDADLETCKASGDIVDQSYLIGKYFSGKVEVELYTESKKNLVRNPSDTLPEGSCIVDYGKVNAPNLDSDNLIPVYYDETSEVWKKADSSNTDNSWFDYNNKKWANAVLVSDTVTTSATDLSGNGNNGTIYGATLTSEGLSFDGIDDYVMVDSLDFNDSKAMTIDFVAQITDDDLSIIFETSINPSDNPGAFYLDTNEGGTNDLTLAMKSEIDSSTSQLVQNLKMVDGIVDPSTFKHYTITFDSTKAYDTFINMFLEGTQQTVTDWTSKAYNDDISDRTITTHPFYIGSRAGTNYFTTMVLKSLRIYNRALTASEVASNHNGDIVNEGLILSYDFVNTQKDYYQDAEVGTTINESSVLGYFVWIPRFKYRVWNITRQGGAESTYAYAAYTNGIDIEFEIGTSSTGNVKCTYNIANTSPSTTLSDTCVYKDTTTITPSSGNTNFNDAWYTHPAFTFNAEEKTGFWIGKFETTGTASSPTVLPDTVSLKDQLVSSQFTSSKVFQNYGLSSSVDAHMITNLEWGAVAYLTHSIFGLCDGTTCRDVYLNNSSEYYTGRSSGTLSKSDVIYSYGIYNYKGYSLNSSTGEPTTTKDTTKIASTTGNITGVYDMSGGAREYVMANMVDSNNAFYPSASGTDWNGSTTLETKYYNAYSYGDSTSDQPAFNRARLGDATAEVTSGVSNDFDAWKPGVGIGAAYSNFVTEYTTSPWLNRSGAYNSTYPGIFNFSRETGDGVTDADSTFRVSIS